MSAVFDPARHEPLLALRWNEQYARDTIGCIVEQTESAFDPDRYWPLHPRDIEPGDDPDQPATGLYHGACGVIWTLEYMAGTGAATLRRDYTSTLDTLLLHNRMALGPGNEAHRGSFLNGDLPIRLLQHRATPTRALEDELERLIEGNLDHPSRELMWGSPGTLLAALFLHERTGDPRWASLFRRTASHLWNQLALADASGCRCWIQDMHGRHSTYLGAVHGFVATALPLIRGRKLLGTQWPQWEACIASTVRRTAIRAGTHVNWPAELRSTHADKRLLQVCHGAPGFVVALGGFPGRSLDDLLVGAGETTWAAGPLAKGAGLCHGTAGNGYAFLALFARSGDAMWLERARAFAMHAILQVESDAARHGRLRYSLWTGDPGVAVYLWDCITGTPRFPTLDVFDPMSPPTRC